jgi:hypothetical protein
LSDRLRCVISGCNRTFKAGDGDGPETRVICGRHWRMAPKSWRMRYTRFKRLAGRPNNPKNELAGHVCNRTWERCRDYIEGVLSGENIDAELARFIDSL